MYILGRFARRNEICIDVLRLLPLPQTDPDKPQWCGFRATVRTCKESDLKNIACVHLGLVKRNLSRGRFLFREVEHVDRVLHIPNVANLNMEFDPEPRVAGTILRIKPQSAASHHCSHPAPWRFQRDVSGALYSFHTSSSLESPTF